MGPLAGLRIIEMAGIGPGPFCAMMLADLGAEIILIDRAVGKSRPIDIDPTLDLTARGRRSLALDLKKPQAIDAVLRICKTADGIVEGFRPGVMERLGLGPDACMAANPRLVYGRMTGWGQDGPLSQIAGHDINYLAISGTLHMMGRANERPSPPLNLVADMGGGGMMLALGMLAAFLERVKSGKGQVIDAAMSEGAALLATTAYSQMRTGWWHHQRGSNLLDSGAHFYEVYATKDDRFVAVGAIERQFYALLLKGLGLDAATLPPQLDRASWPAMKQRLADVFRTRSRDEWAQLFAGSDACVSPVLTPEEAAAHPHAQARKSFVSAGTVQRPVPAPRFSRSAASEAGAAPHSGEHTDRVLLEFGFSGKEIESMRSSGAVA